MKKPPCYCPASPRLAFRLAAIHSGTAAYAVTAQSLAAIKNNDDDWSSNTTSVTTHGVMAGRSNHAASVGHPKKPLSWLVCLEVISHHNEIWGPGQCAADGLDVTTRTISR
jgi:hypothetical protein